MEGQVKFTALWDTVFHAVSSVVYCTFSQMQKVIWVFYAEYMTYYRNSKSSILVCIYKHSRCFLNAFGSTTHTEITFITLDLKTSHNWDLYIIWINKHSIGVWLIGIGHFIIYYIISYYNILPKYNYLKIWNLRLQKKKKKNWNIEKIAFNVVQMKFLAMHITNQKLSVDIFTVRNVKNIFMDHDLYLKKKNVSFWLILDFIFGYCYTYTRATYDRFCGPGSHLMYCMWPYIGKCLSLAFKYFVSVHIKFQMFHKFPDWIILGHFVYHI